MIKILLNTSDSTGEVISFTTFITVISILAVITMFRKLIIYTTKTVDKSLERIIIKVDSIIKPFKFLKEIQFSEIKGFKIENTLKEPTIDALPCRIHLITNDNKSELIFEDTSESYTREIANKIINLTGKNII